MGEREAQGPSLTRDKRTLPTLSNAAEANSWGANLCYMLCSRLF